MRIPSFVCKLLVLLGGIGILEGVATLAINGTNGIGAAEGAGVLGFVLPLYATGLFAYWKRPDLAIARLLLAVGAVWMVTQGTQGLLEGIYEQEGRISELWPVAMLGRFGASAAFVLMAAFLAVFPDGQYERPYQRRLIGAMWIVALAAPVAELLASPEVAVVPLEATAAHDVRNPLAVSALSALDQVPDALYGLVGIFPLLGIPMLVRRYRRASPEQRLQMRWLLLVSVVGVALAASLIVLSATVSGAIEPAVIVVASVFFALLPLSVLIAILRHRLLDVDQLIRRSIVYGGLWLLIAAAYIGVAAAFGIAAGERLPVAVAVVLTVIATLVFQPARRRLERVADRWVFGERLSGAELLARFGATLEETFDPAELSQRLAEAVRRGIRVRWARVLVHRPANGERLLDPQAAAGISRDSDARPAASVPMSHAGEPIGVIEVGPKEDGELSADDRDLLATLARQAAIAIRNANLASELSISLEEIRHQADELAASRERIVQAQDAERRRIERNIHDGVQQELVALIAKVRLARNQLSRDPGVARGTLSELQEEAGHVLNDLRELAHGIHPSVLSDRGLVDAIEARAARLPLDVRVEVSAEVRATRFTDEIEGAAYFTASEALANVLKHASASRVEVRVLIEGKNLVVEVQDDGSGFEPPEAEGSGLENLHDRLEALGGRLVVASRPGRGARITARLPARRAETVRA